MVRLEAGGIGVRIRTSSLDTTLSGSYGIRPAPVKPPWILSFITEVKNTSLNIQRNSNLLIYVIFIRINYSISRPYTFFSGAK